MVTDVASTKDAVVSRVLAAAGADASRYVGGHPMAGRERSGPMAARGDLFVGRPWVLTPVPGTSLAAKALVREAATRLGAVVVELDPASHDEAVALVSHLPQVAASLVAARLVGAPGQAVALAGQGLRDVTRIAASDPVLWAQILAGNAVPLARQLRALRDDLDRAVDALEALAADGADDAPGAGLGRRARPAGGRGQRRAGDRARASTATPRRSGRACPCSSPTAPARSPRSSARSARWASTSRTCASSTAPAGSPAWPRWRCSRPSGTASSPSSATAAGRSPTERRVAWGVVPTPARAGPGRPVTRRRPPPSPRSSPVPVLSRRVLVAVDGPSGSGKSSVSREVARRAGLSYLDTGAMYRAGCWAALRDGIDPTDAETLGVLVRSVVVDVSTDPDVERVVVDGVDVTTAIRGAAVTAAVSAFASHPAVREEMRSRQRATMDAAPTGCIAEGRDITTVVAPDAHVRVLLTADADARVDRRARQVEETRPDGDAASVAPGDVSTAVLDRDAADSQVTSFLTAADGVHELDSSDLDLEQTVEAVLGLVRAAQAELDAAWAAVHPEEPGPRRAGRRAGATRTVTTAGADRTVRAVTDRA